MPDFGFCFIGLHQREGGAGHFLLRLRQGVDEGAGESGLARAKVALQRNDISLPQQWRQANGQHAHVFFIFDTQAARWHNADSRGKTWP